MHWPRDLEGWPNRAYSTRISGPVHRWHVQQVRKRGGLPTLLLLHGAGGSTHSWRHQLDPLSDAWQVIVPDLPGHGFTTLGLRNRSGLSPMAKDLVSLCLSQSWIPDVILGHSAGVALALEMTRTGPFAGLPVVGINAALGSFPGLAGVLFPAIAQLMAATPFMPRLVARKVGHTSQIARLVQSTGSTLDTEGLDLFRRLAADSDHIAGTLRMMSQWNLEPLQDALPVHLSPTYLLAAEGDLTVPPHVSEDAARRMPVAEITLIPRLGHLAHEEAPEVFWPVLHAALQQARESLLHKEPAE